jgi:hypothetical protein
MARPLLSDVSHPGYLSEPDRIPDYFLKDNPLPMMLSGARDAPEYGRAMLCRNDRMVAWLGLYVEMELRG